MSLAQFTVEDRGFATACHVWTGRRDPSGRGLVVIERRDVRVYRLVWEQAHGPVPAGRELDHLCRVPACVRLEHLDCVTHAENMRRGARVKLTREQVGEIKALGASLLQREIAALYGISSSHVNRILKGEKWGDTARRPLVGGPFDGASARFTGALRWIDVKGRAWREPKPGRVLYRNGQVVGPGEGECIGCGAFLAAQGSACVLCGAPTRGGSDGAGQSSSRGGERAGRGAEADEADGAPAPARARAAGGREH